MLKKHLSFILYLALISANVHAVKEKAAIKFATNIINTTYDINENKQYSEKKKKELIAKNIQDSLNLESSLKSALGSDRSNLSPEEFDALMQKYPHFINQSLDILIEKLMQMDRKDIKIINKVAKISESTSVVSVNFPSENGSMSILEINIKEKNDQLYVLDFSISGVSIRSVQREIVQQLIEENGLHNLIKSF